MTYEQTTKYHWPLLTERNTTGYTDGLPEIVYGQLGFDDAVKLNTGQVNFYTIQLINRIKYIRIFFAVYHQDELPDPQRPLHRQPEILPLRSLLFYLGKGRIRPRSAQHQNEARQKVYFQHRRRIRHERKQSVSRLGTVP